jgi:uncharacterized membrane protein
MEQRQENFKAFIPNFKKVLKKCAKKKLKGKTGPPLWKLIMGPILEKQLKEAGLGIDNLPLVQRIFYGKKYMRKKKRSKMMGVIKSNVKLNDWKLGKLNETKFGKLLNEINTNLNMKDNRSNFGFIEILISAFLNIPLLPFGQLWMRTQFFNGARDFPYLMGIPLFHIVPFSIIPSYLGSIGSFNSGDNNNVINVNSLIPMISMIALSILFYDIFGLNNIIGQILLYLGIFITTLYLRIKRKKKYCNSEEKYNFKTLWEDNRAEILDSLYIATYGMGLRFISKLEIVNPFINLITEYLPILKNSIYSIIGGLGLVYAYMYSNLMIDNENCLRVPKKLEWIFNGIAILIILGFNSFISTEFYKDPISFINNILA